MIPYIVTLAVIALVAVCAWGIRRAVRRQDQECQRDEDGGWV